VLRAGGDRLHGAAQLIEQVLHVPLHSAGGPAVQHLVVGMLHELLDFLQVEEDP